jgi:ABC-2 type transport system permease protein
VPTWAYFAGLLAHCVLVSLVDIVLIVGVGRMYGLALPADWPAILVTLVLGAASFCALGVAVASVISNAEAAPAVAQLALFPLLFLSGTYMPITSHVLNTITAWLPVRPFNQALLGSFGPHGGPGWGHLGVLLIWGAVGALVAIRRFRWNPRPE